jgi:dTDP-glucose pyrophosphorylase
VNAVNKQLLIREGETIKSALRSLNQSARKVLFVVDADGCLLGSLSDGDIRRALLRDVGLEATIDGVYNRAPVCFREGAFAPEEARQQFIAKRIELIPIVDDGGRVVRAIEWEDLFVEERMAQPRGPALGVPVVIMAGGKGARLAPFTTVLPKPLIPVGDRTVMELIIDSFRGFGVDRFYFTLNYRAEMIKAYFEGLEKPYTVTYVREEDFYGTAGSLKLLEDQIERTFVVSNCDILVKANYAEVLSFHRESRAQLTIVSSIQFHTVPYGVVDFATGGAVTGIREKPAFTFPINTGVYILERDCLRRIPAGRVFHMTDLVDALLAAGERVMTYPVNASEYQDIGQWDEYQKTVNQLRFGRGGL